MSDFSRIQESFLIW